MTVSKEPGNEDPKAALRREALRQGIARVRMNPTQLARKAGLKSANALFNYLGGHSRGLSRETYEALARVMPSATVASLMGEEDMSDPRRYLVPVRSAVEAGVWRPTFDLPLAEQSEAPVPIDEESRLAGAFAVRVRGAGTEKLYPEGTLLVLVPLDADQGHIADGRKLVLQRIREGKFEVTLRSLRVSDGRAWLMAHTDSPELMQPVSMPWPYTGKPWKEGEERFMIAGVVIMACIHEG